MQTAGEMIGKIVVGEVAVGYGLNEAIDIISSSLADFISFSGLGIALLIALGLRFIAGGLYGILRARSIDVAEGKVIDIEEQEAILLKKGRPLSAWLVRKLNKKRFARLLKLLAKKGVFSSLLSKLTSRYKHKHRKAAGAKVAKAAKVVKAAQSVGKKAEKPKKAKAMAKAAKSSAKKSAEGGKAAKTVYAKQLKSQLKQTSKHYSGIRKLADALFKKRAKAVDYAFAVDAAKGLTKHYKHEASLHKRASQLTKHVRYLRAQGDKANSASQQHKGFFKADSGVKQSATKEAFKPPVVGAHAS